MMGDQLRAVTIGALIAIAGVLVGSTDATVSAEAKLLGAAVLGVVAVAIGVRPGRRLT